MGAEFFLDLDIATKWRIETPVRQATCLSPCRRSRPAFHLLAPILQPWGPSFYQTVHIYPPLFPLVHLSPLSYQLAHLCPPLFPFVHPLTPSQPPVCPLLRQLPTDATQDLLSAPSLKTRLRNLTKGVVASKSPPSPLLTNWPWVETLTCVFLSLSRVYFTILECKVGLCNVDFGLLGQ